jgi:hypothetical protein
MRTLLVALLLAQTTVQQGNGNSQVTEWKESVAGRAAAATTNICVGTTATAMPTHPLLDRKAVEVQNNGGGVIYCTVDGSTPVVGSNGRWIAPGSAMSFTLGERVQLQCIAAAPQTSGGCSTVSELGTQTYWTNNGLPFGYTYGTIYANGKFITVGSTYTPLNPANNAPLIATSPDCVTWTQVVSPAAEWQGIAYNGTTFVVVGSTLDFTNGAIASSPDGVNWTLRASPGAGTYYAVMWDGARFITVGQNYALTGGIEATSPDGITWTNVPSIPAGGWYNIAYNGTRYVISGLNDANTAGIEAYSPDAATWTNPGSAVIAANQWYRSVWTGAQFVLAGTTVPLINGAQIATSPDGITWTNQLSGPATSAFFGLVWTGSQLSAVGFTKSGIPGLAYTSPTGVTWTQQLNIPYGDYYSEAWSGSIFCAVGENPGQQANISTYSTDGVTWH